MTHTRRQPRPLQHHPPRVGHAVLSSDNSFHVSKDPVHPENHSVVMDLRSEPRNPLEPTSIQEPALSLESSPSYTT